MSNDTKTQPTPAAILNDLVSLRRSASRKEATVALAKIAAEMAPYRQVNGGGAIEQSRSKVADAIAALSEAYRQTDKLVPDNLWATAVNLAYAWRNAEGEATDRD